MDGLSQWDTILCPCWAHWLPEDLVWLQMLPLLGRAPSTQISRLCLPWILC